MAIAIPNRQITPGTKDSTGFATTAPEFKQNPKKDKAVLENEAVKSENDGVTQTRIQSWIMDNWWILAIAGLVSWLIWRNI